MMRDGGFLNLLVRMSNAVFGDSWSYHHLEPDAHTMLAEHCEQSYKIIYNVQSNIPYFIYMGSDTNALITCSIYTKYALSGICLPGVNVA